ncbi:MAG: peptidoglycan DD-metalloendopeptidase family protein [bacterium]|nr:peptidoglycan DD-metalloendopeptidase family protein [bacterium]MDT8395232.1 peptidoglycan DD-metalloendopeptidase family protein [bacterium]
MIHNPLPKRNTHLRDRPRVRSRYLVLAVLGLGVLCVSRPAFSPQARIMQPSGPLITDVVAGEAPSAAEPEPVISVTNKVVRRGDTLYDILKADGVPDPEILQIAGTRVDGIRPSSLVAGRTYRLHYEEEQLVEYQYEPDDMRFIRVAFGEGDPVISIEPIPYEIVREPISGVIEDSLFAAVESIGEKPALAMDLADIFAWQVDFFRDLRNGDSFAVVVDKYYRDGEFVRYGRIEAARFVNNKTTHRAFLYSPGSGLEDYFDEEGGSLRKQFLKVPLRFQRISSGFSARRLHPVTGKVVPHLGVDYAAPTGTPIMSIGDGKVVMIKRDEANGRIIKIRHNSVYSSAYAHMNSFASGMKVGTQVRQGQVIGYVGSSGRATGPHLHFAMYRNNKYVDPRRISVPRATSVPGADLEQFKAVVRELDQQLPGGLAGQVAENGGDADVLR